MQLPAEQVNAVYQRLLAREPDATSDCIELFLDPLINALRARYPNLPDPDIVSDVVTDSLFAFVQAPERYQPERGSLWNYLYMDALRDLGNTLDKERRRHGREIPFDPVAHERPDRNTNVEDTVLQRLETSALLARPETQAVLKQLRTKIPDELEWRVILLMFSGERRTEMYAAELGIERLPLPEQRKQVKQVKDRLRLRLKRYGVNIHEH